MIKLNEIQAKYGEYLVDEDKLKELLVKPKPETVWGLKYGDKYYCLDNAGNINTINNISYDTCTKDAWDLTVRESGNIFLTYDEAKFELERRKCEAIMLKYGRRTFKPRDINYIIQFDNDDKQVFVDFWRLNQFQGSICFDTEELAQKAIDEIGKERLKKYVFRVEE